jgi:hypothetical protein
MKDYEMLDKRNAHGVTNTANASVSRREEQENTLADCLASDYFDHLFF